MAKGEQLNRDEWTRVVERRLGTADFEVVATKELPLGEGSTGFLGDHRLAEVVVRAPADRRREPRTLNFFLKGIPSFESQMTVCEVTGVFKKEVDALSVLFPELRSSLNDAGRDMAWTCDCYYTRPDLIVLDDLVAQGFKIVGTRETITFHHAAIVMKTLANLHSAALINEESHPPQQLRLNSVYPDLLKESFFVDGSTQDHPGRLWAESSLGGVMHLVELVRDKETCLRLKEKLAKMVRIIFDLQLPSEKYRNVVCHGDLWRNNIFFRFEDDKPVEARLVDFQLVRYAPPANDVMCFLYLAIDRRFREQHLPQLLAAYHRHLSENLKAYGILAENVLPWEEFEESCELYKKLGIYLSNFERQVTLLKEEGMGEMLSSSEDFETFLGGDRSPQISDAFKSDAQYREGVIEMIEELLEFIEKE